MLMPNQSTQKLQVWVSLEIFGKSPDTYERKKDGGNKSISVRFHQYFIFCSHLLFFMLGLLQMWKGWRNSCTTSTNQDQVCLLKWFSRSSHPGAWSFWQYNSWNYGNHVANCRCKSFFWQKCTRNGQTESGIIIMKYPFLCTSCYDATSISRYLVLKVTKCPSFSIWFSKHIKPFW